MEADVQSEPLAGAEIHGFLTVADLNREKLMEEAATRWFRPNEVHAILSNYTLFKVQPQPIENPPSGMVLLFDRKVVRNFRKDGHNWKKKKDGKAVQEAHEKLKVGNEERVHVYYARGEDDPNFYRRCYWLLDKTLERIVLVHYRCTAEDNALSPDALVDIGSVESTPLSSKKLNLNPLTPVDSNSSSQHSEVSGVGILSDEFNSQKNNGTGNKEFTLDEINTLDWDDLLESSPIHNNPMPAQQGGFGSMASQLDPSNIMDVNLMKNGAFTPMQSPYHVQPAGTLTGYSGYLQPLTDGAQLTGLNYKEAPSLLNDPSIQSSLSQKLIFYVTDMSPDWASCTDETKVVVVGYFHEQYKHLSQSNLYCIVGGKCVSAVTIQPGVYRVLVPPNTSGHTDLYITLDGQNPISQVLPFKYLSNPNNPTYGSENPYPDLNSQNFLLQTRLAHLLFSSSNKISSLSNKLPQKQSKEAIKFVSQTSPVMERYWTNLFKRVHEGKTKTEGLLEMVLRNKVQEWLLEKVSEGCKASLDEQGQGVIHLCVMLDYVWSIRLFALSGLSLDFRDSAGWTALHWAAFYGRERMVASLLSAGANPSLVTDPTPDSPGGFTAADLAAKQGFEGLAAYLAEKGLTAHFEAMSLHGNLGSNPYHKSTISKTEKPGFTNLSEQELCLKDSLAAYRNAAEAATKIQAAFRERALKLQTKAVQMEKSVSEAELIVAALRIQNAYRNYSRRKVMRAAARIQSHFRTWKVRRNFLIMRRHAIHIQAVFRGHQVRRQYKKIIWSVGVVEKAILRWRLKRRGLRGILQAAEATTVAMKVDSGTSSSTGDDATGEEDFFKISREQAEERYKRSVVRVQALFRSYRAQQEYRRMKMTYEQAELEFSDQSEGD